MEIHHRPISKDIDKIIKLYSEKDQVSIKYVCTSSTRERGRIYDIFYRMDNSPHPEFGNRYFGITYIDGLPWIGNADNVENLTFNVVNGVYSRNEHDYVDTGVGVALDGGRDYLRLVGDIRCQVDTYTIKNGEFVKKELDNSS
tara:strand:- start:3182 stop:3610 length:429 start_codon:yes stop_codon:yes gene_type:complete